MSEFGEKKDVARVLEQKELKVGSLTQEVNGLRSLIRSKDRVIFGFKRELSSMVHIGLPKDLEQAVKARLHSLFSKTFRSSCFERLRRLRTRP